MTAKSAVLIADSDVARVQLGPDPWHRILVVDDESVIRMIHAGLLIKNGYKVDTAADGHAAWEALATDKYDLLITDNQMPRVSGVELLRMLHGARKAMPVIMATGTPPRNEFVREPWLQPAAVLLKPYTGAELLATVAQVLQGIYTIHAPLRSAFAGGADYTSRTPDLLATGTTSMKNTTQKQTASRQPRTNSRHDEPTHDEIAVRAYFIWEKQGHARNQEVGNWMQAQSQLRQPLDQYSITA